MFLMQTNKNSLSHMAEAIYTWLFHLKVATFFALLHGLMATLPISRWNFLYNVIGRYPKCVVKSFFVFQPILAVAEIWFKRTTTFWIPTYYNVIVRYPKCVVKSFFVLQPILAVAEIWFKRTTSLPKLEYATSSLLKFTILIQ